MLKIFVMLLLVTWAFCRTETPRLETRCATIPAAGEAVMKPAGSSPTTRTADASATSVPDAAGACVPNAAGACVPDAVGAAASDTASKPGRKTSASVYIIVRNSDNHDGHRH